MTLHPLASLYVTANKETFMNPSTDAAIAAWPKHFSKSLVVKQNGTTMDSDGFLAQMKEAKAKWPVIDVRYKMLTAFEPKEGESGPRSVGSAEHVWIPEAKMWFDTIIIMKFGEVGTEDENKLVEFHETMTVITTKRDPHAKEYQSIA
jgi:hypothetical protein